MIAKGLSLIDRYNALILRQRIVLLLAFLSVFYFIWYFLFLLPILTESKNLETENAYLASLHEEDSEIGELNKREGKALGIVSLNNKLSNLKSEVNSLNVELKKYFSIVSSSNDLMSIVKDLVDTTDGVHLKAIELLPIERIVVNTFKEKHYEEELSDNRTRGKNITVEGSRSQDDSDVVIYKHKIIIEVEAGYAGLVQYLNQIESLGWGLFMQDIHYKIEQHPNANVSLLLYSLSLGGDISSAGQSSRVEISKVESTKVKSNDL